MLNDISFKEEQKMNLKGGWELLIECFMCAVPAYLFFSLVGYELSPEAGDYYGAIAAVIGFIAPAVVYIGNRI